MYYANSIDPQTGLPSNPTEETFVYFVSHCSSNLNLSFKTIKLYLSGIRHAYIDSGLGDPFKLHNLAPMLQLHQVLRGIKKCQRQTDRPRLPITFDILTAFTKFMCRGFFGPYLDSMMKAVCSVAFFGFLRCGEFTTSQYEFDAAYNLSRNDIVFNSQYSDVVDEMHICLKSSKTDPFRQGVIIKLFKTTGHTCPIVNTIEFLQKRDAIHPRPWSDSPLFAMPTGAPLTRKCFISMLNQLCSATGLNPSHYSGHSLRIGAATTAARHNVPDHLIQVLGRWSSDCYKTYIKTSPHSIAQAQRTMAH